MKNDKSPGPDDLTAYIIKLLDGEGLEDVLDILNGWWENRKMPDEAKTTQVVSYTRRAAQTNKKLTGQ